MSNTLRNLRLLVLEDEVLIGLDLEDALTSAGARSVAVVDTIARAEAHMAVSPLPDIALLDVVVADGQTFDLARNLLALGVKVAFVTGYSHGIPGDLAHCPVVEKPFASQDLVAAISRAAAGRQGDL